MTEQTKMSIADQIRVLCLVRATLTHDPEAAYLTNLDLAGMVTQAYPQMMVDYLLDEIERQVVVARQKYETTIW